MTETLANATDEQLQGSLAFCKSHNLNILCDAILKEMGRRVAVELARMDPAYAARLSRSGHWIVWDSKSDHEVEFNH